MPAPALDDDPRLVESVEDLAVEQLVPEPGIEALDIAILPGAAWSDVGGLGSDRRDPLLDGLGRIGAEAGERLAYICQSLAIARRCHADDSPHKEGGVRDQRHPRAPEVTEGQAL